MADTVIGKADFEVGANTAPLTKALGDAETKIKATGGAFDRFGSQIGTAIKGGALAAAGGFALAAKGALQAQDAQGKFMAATGQSREEAKAFVSQMDSLAGSSGAVGMSFEDIASAGTMVQQQFGVTGDKATALTENILEFAKVTGQDATGAAADMEDTLSAFGLSADDASGFMDQLVASSQKYGTDAGPASVAALNNMAPALTAMGMGLGDGVELLNAFEVAGGNADDAAKGLQTAIKQLQPGQDIDDLITQIAGIQDPMLKNEAATAAFGKKMGPELAALIKPGMTSLDDFGVSAKDAAGAVGKASDDMLTDADKIRGFADKALAGARELGQQFGPALTGLASLGSLAAPLASGAKDLLMKVGPQIAETAGAQGLIVGGAMADGEAEGAAGTGAISKIGARIAAMQIPLAAEGTTVGGAVGSAMGAATAAGMAAGFVAAAAGTAFIWEKALEAVISDPIKQAVVEKEVGAYAANEIALGFSQEIVDNGSAAMRSAMNLALAKGVPIEQIPQLGEDAGFAFYSGLNDVGRALGPDDLKGFTTAFTTALAGGASLDEAKAAAVKAVQVVIDAATQTAATQGAAPVAAWVKAMAGAASQNAQSLSLWALVRDKQVADAAKAKEIFDSSAQGITGSMAATLRKGAKGDISSAMDDLTWAIKHPLQLTKQVAQVEAALTSQKLKQGLASQNPEIKAQAQQTQARLAAIYQSLTGKAYNAGGDTSAAWQNSLNDNYPKAIADARFAANSINAWLRSIKSHVHVNVEVDTTGQGPTARGGGRALGGPVKANTMYQVTEGGIPELLSMAGKTYLMTGRLGGYVSKIGDALKMPSLAPAMAPAGATVVQPVIHLHAAMVDDSTIFKFGRELDRVYRHWNRR